MKTIITERLAAIEKEHDLKILFSCESGSRGWDVPSPDSDYDVRFIYIRPYSFYLSVMERKNNLDFPINKELDIAGWDIRKVLQLIRKSNTTPFEWLQSPYIYREEEDFRKNLWSLCQHFFGQKTNIRHYLGIAKGALDTVTNDKEIKIKKLFYVLRPLLAAKWCLEKDTIAPMNIWPLMDLLPADLMPLVENLIAYKSTAEEATSITINPVLKSYIENEFSNISRASENLLTTEFETNKLDDFFIKTLTSYDN